MLGLTVIALSLFLAIVYWQRTAHANHESEKTAVDERAALIESALYTRVEFFSAQALVPYPTGAARNRLAAVQALTARGPLFFRDAERRVRIANYNQPSEWIEL